MKPRRPNYSHDFGGVYYRDELKFKPDPSIRALIGKGDYSVILDGASYLGTNQELLASGGLFANLHSLNFASFDDVPKELMK